MRGLSELGTDSRSECSPRSMGRYKNRQRALNTEGGGCPSHSPLYLTAAEIVDLVEFDAQYRMEEEAAAEEGAAIEASNLPYPEYERNGR